LNNKAIYIYLTLVSFLLLAFSGQAQQLNTVNTVKSADTLKSIDTKTSVETAYVKARRLAFDKQYGESISVCDSFLTQEPDNYDFEVLNARVMSWDGHLKEAEKKAENLNSKYPKSKEVIVLWATINKWMEDYETSMDL